MVTWSGSPPKYAMLSLTQTKASSWSLRPWEWPMHCCYWWWCWCWCWCWWLMMIILTLWSGTQVKDRCCQLWHELQESWNKKNLVPWKFLGVHRQKAHKAKPDKDHIRKQNKQKKKLVLLSLMKSRCSPIVDWDKNNPFINQKAGLLIIGPLT